MHTDRDTPITEPETTPNHTHLLVPADPQHGVHRPVKQIKGCSSRLLHQQVPHLRSPPPTRWTNSYSIATIGGATLEVVKRHVENQHNV